MFAIIVPYRNREFFKQHLINEVPKYIEKTHGLSPNGFNYKIIFSEQKDDDLFKVTLARNYGALWACLNFIDVTHFIFQDVDCLPIKNIDYQTPIIKFHLLGYGSSKIPKEDFLTVNGYNPLFMGWGGEDNEIYARIRFKLKVGDQKFRHLLDENCNGDNFNSIYEDLECKYGNSSYFSSNEIDRWKSDRPNYKNELYESIFYALNDDQKNKWISKFGLNLIKINSDRHKLIDKNDFIINLEYDNTCLDPKVFEMRNKL